MTAINYPDKKCSCGKTIFCWGRSQHGDLIYPLTCFDCLKEKINQIVKEVTHV